MPLDPAEALEPADQATSGNVPLQRLNVHPEQTRRRRRADDTAFAKCRRDRGVIAGVNRHCLGQIHLPTAFLAKVKRSPSSSTRPASSSRSTTLSAILLVPNRQPPRRRSNGAMRNSRK
jgi:hypothetical protein